MLGLPASGQRSDELNGYLRGRRWKQYRGYAEDKWTVTPKLTLNLGLAYGVTTPLSESANRFANFDFKTGKLYVAGQNADKNVGVQYDYSNVEPRFGFSYSPFKSQKTVFRGGYGIFHDVSAQSGAGGLQQNPPFVNEYGFTSDNITPVRTLATGFPDNSQPQDFASYTGNLTAEDINYKQGLIQQYNVNIQQQLPASTVFTIAYAASHGTRLLDKGINLNTAPPGPGFNDPARRPYPQYNTISGFTSHGWVGYQSLQAKAERRAASGLYLLASYTYSKTLTNGMTSDTISDPGVPYYPLVPFRNADKGPRGYRSAPQLRAQLAVCASVRNGATIRRAHQQAYGRGAGRMADERHCFSAQRLPPRYAGKCEQLRHRHQHSAGPCLQPRPRQQGKHQPVVQHGLLPAAASRPAW